MEVLHLIGRIIFGLFFIHSGINHLFLARGPLTGYGRSKGLPAPGAAVVASGVLLLLGGLSVGFGFLPWIGIILLLVFLITVSFTMHAYWTEQGEARMGDRINFLKNWALIGALLIFFAIPLPWPISVHR